MKLRVYVRTNCNNIRTYALMKQALGKFFTDPPGYPNNPNYHLTPFLKGSVLDDKYLLAPTMELLGYPVTAHATGLQ